MTEIHGTEKWFPTVSEISRSVTWIKVGINKIFKDSRLFS